MENIKYFLTDNQEVSEEELWALIHKFHEKNPNLPFEYYEQRGDTKRGPVQVFDSPKAFLQWEIDLYHAAQLNKN